MVVLAVVGGKQVRAGAAPATSRGSKTNMAVITEEAVLSSDGYGTTDQIHSPARARPTILGSLGSTGGLLGVTQAHKIWVMYTAKPKGLLNQ